MSSATPVVITSLSALDTLVQATSHTGYASSLSDTDVSTKEKIYFGLMIFISALVYLVAFSDLRLLTGMSAILFYIGLYGVFFWIAHGMFVASIRCNAVKVQPDQLPELYALVQDIAHRMQLRRVPDAYVLESGGMLNAFATKFLGRSFIVLYSDLLELATQEGEDTVAFVVAHEMAHIKRGHTGAWYRIFMLPGLIFPFLAGAYYRACEYTCDAMAQRLFPRGAIQGMLILSAGKTLYRHLQVMPLLRQLQAEAGFWSWLSEIFSTHPHLLCRLKALVDREPSLLR
jgi:Zn-dependent protease with chaperone function